METKFLVGIEATEREIQRQSERLNEKKARHSKPGKLGLSRSCKACERIIDEAIAACKGDMITGWTGKVGM